MKILYLLFFILILSSCWTASIDNKDNINYNDSLNKEQFDSKENSLIYNKEEFLSWNYLNVINNLEKSSDNSYDSKILLAESYLNYWNAYYNESDYSKKALDILNNMEDNYKVLFLKWYANEIIKNYEQAWKYYYSILELENIGDIEKSVVYNQIGHLNQLLWFSEEAYNYYKKAYELNNKNVSINLNIWRILIHFWDITQWKKYFEYALENTNNSFLKSEIYYWLSSLVLYSDTKNTTKDLYNTFEESLNYAELSLNQNDKYPLSHVWYARWLILMDKDLETAKKHLDDALNIYPNLSIAHKYLWYLNLNNKKFNQAITSFDKSISSLDEDITLMWYEKSNKWELFFQIAYSYANLWNKEKALEYIKKTINSQSNYANKLLFSEISKENNWAFAILVWNDYFDRLLSLLNIN